MANPLKGEVAFEVDGQPMVLVFSFEAMCVLEGRLDLGIGEITKLLKSNPRLELIRTVFWAGLREYHREVTERDTGELIRSLSPTVVGGLIGKAFLNSFGPEEKAAEPRPTKRVRAKRPGTGRNSTNSGIS